MCVICGLGFVQLDGSPIVVAQNDKFDGEDIWVELELYNVHFCSSRFLG